MVALTTLISGGITNLPQVGTGLDGLNDVDLVSNPLAIGDVLIYDGTNWITTPDITTGITDYLNKVATPVARQTGTTIVPISVGTTAPTSPAIGDLWVDTN